MTGVKRLIFEAQQGGSFVIFDQDQDHLDAIGDWLVGPVGRTRDSALSSESNFEVAIARMRAVDPEEQDYEILRFGHWACGWIEELATRPGSRCAQIAQEVKESLDIYPILDEHDHSQRVADRESENWSEILRDARRMIKTHCRQNWPAWTDEHDDAVDDLTDERTDVAVTDRGESDGEGWVRYSSCDIERIADSLRDDLGYITSDDEIDLSEGLPLDSHE